MAARTIDYFVVSKALASCVVGVRAHPDAPLHPHAPVSLQLAGLQSQRMVQVPVRFKPFDVHPLIGPKRYDLPFDWSWPAGTRAACPIEQMLQEWCHFAEQ